MLKLSGPNESIILDVLGYQFPDIEPDGEDSEWLRVSGAVQSTSGNWRFVDCCLMTTDLMELASWLNELPASSSKRELEFIEPCLRFERIEATSGDALHVHFAHEAAPPWLGYEERIDEGFAVKIPFDCIDFAAVSSAVNELSKRFPFRAQRSGA